MTEQRAWTPIDTLADEWTRTLATCSPLFATWAGVPGDHTALDDFSPEGEASLHAKRDEVLSRLAVLAPVDATDALTKSELTRDLTLSNAIADSGWPLRNLNNIESAPQTFRDILDLMPTDTADDWEAIAGRIGNIAEGLARYRRSLELGIRRGVVPAKRQIAIVIDQIAANIGDTGYFAELARDAATTTGDALPVSLAADLERSAKSAAEGYDSLRSFLKSDLLPVGADVDGVGRDFYSLLSQQFVGTKVDLDETYEWGVEELARMASEQEAIAQQIVPGATVKEAVEFLDHDEAHALHGTDALRAWMQNLADTAIETLGREHFDIPTPVRRLECLIAPTHTGSIYYTSPSDDFSRPGSMWWSVPDGVDTFNTWRETTTVYHEGVPGHHLQLGMSVYQRAQLNSWRRLASGASGFFEGWALYAERLMDHLGYLTTPADRLGMLDGQRLRAARVVLDIGVHLGKQRPDGLGVWDGDYALEFLTENVNMDPATVAFECNRYLGWPGQAPSYKIGQRVWESTRDDYLAARPGSTLKDFHSDALSLGSLSLDGLRAALL